MGLHNPNNVAPRFRAGHEDAHNPDNVAGQASQDGITARVAQG
jgi:hypothetical protein